jgi:hypothetical protein
MSTERERNLMNTSTPDNARGTENRGKGVVARVRGLFFGLAFFAAGMALSAWWFLRAPPPVPAGPESAGSPALSEATKAVLRGLDSPVEIRFYSLLDAQGASDSERAFSGRVDQLLAQYEQESAGKIKVSRSKTLSTDIENAALADGIIPFHLDRGDGCYLGIAVVRAKQKETLPTLAPEWEQALEPDLTRAIARATEAVSEAVFVSRPDPAALDAVRRLIPNVDSVSLAEGTDALRQSSLAQLKTEVQEMQARVKAAEDRFLQAQADQSQAGQEAARKDLQQIQADLLVSQRRLTAMSQAQLNALQQIKGAAH